MTKPTTRDEAKVESILIDLEDGKSLREAAINAGVAASTFLGWRDADKDLTERYARARMIGAEVEFESMDEIAEAEPERDDKGKIDPAWVALQKLKLDNKKWQLARKRPERYGDKLDVTSGGDKVGFAINIDMGEKE